MIATDFIYDGQRLSDLGYMICQFDEGGGFATDSAGSSIEFSQVPVNSGRRYILTGAKYNTPFEGQISICKPCGDAFTESEYGALMRWLNRPDYHNLYLGSDSFEYVTGYSVSSSGITATASDGNETAFSTIVGLAGAKTSMANNYVETHYRGTFNVEKVEHRGEIIGFTLTFISDGPFGYAAPVTYAFSLTASSSYTITDDSDEVGYIYPASLQVTCSSAGNLTLTNSIESRETTVNNVTSGEILTCDNNIATLDTSKSAHDVLSDFNYKFLRIANTYTTRTNTITSTLPCSIVLTYTPRRKVVF